MKKIILLKVKKGKLQQWKKWCEKLMKEYRNEAVASLKDENVIQELCALFVVGDEYYVAGLNESEYNKKIKPANYDLKINQEHKKQREECLEPVSRGIILYNLP